MRWLPSTRALGDLNNYTTDFPAAETALSHGLGGRLHAVSRGVFRLGNSHGAAPLNRSKRWTRPLGNLLRSP